MYLDDIFLTAVSQYYSYLGGHCLCFGQIKNVLKCSKEILEESTELMLNQKHEQNQATTVCAKSTIERIRLIDHSLHPKYVNILKRGV